MDLKHAFGFHNWGKWEEYMLEGTRVLAGLAYPADVRGKSFPFQEWHQKRKCETCGFIQDKTIKK